MHFQSGIPPDIPVCGFEGELCSKYEYASYIIPILLAVTITCLFFLSLGSLAIWRYYKAQCEMHLFILPIHK